MYRYRKTLAIIDLLSLRAGIATPPRSARRRNSKTAAGDTALGRSVPRSLSRRPGNAPGPAPPEIATGRRTAQAGEPETAATTHPLAAGRTPLLDEGGCLTLIETNHLLHLGIVLLPRYWRSPSDPNHPATIPGGRPHTTRTSNRNRKQPTRRRHSAALRQYGRSQFDRSR